MRRGPLRRQDRSVAVVGQSDVRAGPRKELSAPIWIDLFRLRRYPVPVLSSIVLLAGLLAGLAIETWDFAHCASPSFGVFSRAIVLGPRALRRWRVI